MNIKKLLAVGIILLFIGITYAPGIIAYNSSLVNTIYVDDDNIKGPWDGTQEHPYQHIQDGVINANNGDIIFVNSGFYHENVNIDKPITLIGADVRNTTIDGDKSNHAVFIKSNSVKISGFTIQEGYTGILVANSSDISINDNFIIDNIAGVAIRWNSNNNSVYNNEIRRSEIGGPPITPFRLRFLVKPYTPLGLRSCRIPARRIQHGSLC
jgi:pectin methylesterase-like acyl-CoA thioesterase